MARKVFYSFHYNPDNWRASQVRNIGAIEGNQPAKDNDWETITKGGDKAIEKWIADQMSGRSCVVVLIGAGTANRKWINHEIVKGWNDGKGVLGIYVHNLKNSEGKTSSKGSSGAPRRPERSITRIAFACRIAPTRSETSFTGWPRACTIIRR